MTRDTAAFLLELLNMQQLPVGAPDFAETAERCAKAKAELLAVIKAPED